MKVIPKKRRLMNKTDYRKRKKFLENANLRVVIRKTNRYIILEYIETEITQDKVILNVNSKILLKYGWPKKHKGSLKSLTACYLAGIILGKKLAKIGKNEKVIIDTGLIKSTKCSRVYSAIKGIVDSGFKINHNPKMFPDEKRINNEKVKDFFEKIKNKIEKE